MDVGDPSNFVRVLELFRSEFNSLQKNISSYSISDEETESTIVDVFSRTKYVLDPHGAVAYASLKKYLKGHAGEKGIFLETAHPVKFPDAVEKLTGKKIEMPQALQSLLNRPKQALKLNAEYELLKDYLLNSSHLRK